MEQKRNEDIKFTQMHEEVANRVADILIEKDVSPRDALIILSAFSEMLFQVMIQDPEGFYNSKLIDILGANK